MLSPNGNHKIIRSAFRAPVVGSAKNLHNFSSCERNRTMPAPDPLATSPKIHRLGQIAHVCRWTCATKNKRKSSELTSAHNANGGLKLLRFFHRSTPPLSHSSHHSILSEKIAHFIMITVANRSAPRIPSLASLAGLKHFSSCG